MGFIGGYLFHQQFLSSMLGGLELLMQKLFVLNIPKERNHRVLDQVIWEATQFHCAVPPHNFQIFASKVDELHGIYGLVPHLETTTCHQTHDQIISSCDGRKCEINQHL